MRRIALVMIMLMSFAAAFAEEKVWTKSYEAVYYELTDYESSNAEDIMGYVLEAGLPLNRVKKISTTQWEAIMAIMNRYDYSSDEYYQFAFETQSTDYIVEIMIGENNKVSAILYTVEAEAKYE